jgi:hypothetical protein
LPAASLLSRDQKREYSLGWLSWLGAETIGVAAALFNLVWVPFIALGVVAIPDRLLTLPIIAAFVVALLHFGLSYRLRVRVPFWHTIGAMFVFMSVQWTVASTVTRAALKGGQRYFHRTRKGESSGPHRRQFPGTAEAVLGGLLVLGALMLIATNIYLVVETNLFAAVLLVQALPFISAMGIELLEYVGFQKQTTSDAGCLIENPSDYLQEPETRRNAPSNSAAAA